MSRCGILSFSFILNIFLSIALCIDLIFVIYCLFIAHVSHPYAVVGIMHWLKTCLFNDSGRFLSINISLFFPKQLQLFLILSLISSSDFLFVVVICPK